MQLLQVNELNDSSQTVGFYTLNGYSQAAISTFGHVSDLSQYLGPISNATDINNSGYVVGTIVIVPELWILIIQVKL